MTTSTSTGLSADAKEFIPSITIPPPTTIPLYVDENIIASVYTTEPQQQTLIYPLIKIPEIEFRIPPSTNDNSSQMAFLPTPGCYPGTPISTFYPIDYPDQSLMNYSLPQHQQLKSNRISAFQPKRGFNHSTNSKRTPKGAHSRSNRKNDDKNAFQLRAEDFPSLPMNEKIPTPVSIPNDTESKPSWNTVVATSRPHSKSPTQTKRSDRSPSLTKQPSKPNPSIEQSRSQSLTSAEEFTQTKQQKKRTKQKKKKSKEPPSPPPPPTVITPEPTSFSLDDESAFPTLGQEVPVSLPPKSPNTTKTNTPGLINTPKQKGNHSYQIRLTDMFNALSVSTQTKSQNTQNKPNKSSANTVNSANPLDSNPVPKRGKEREQPKPRKPTKLKRIINKELEENQKQRQQLLTKIPALKQLDENHVNDLSHESDSATSTDEFDDDDDDDEILDHEPTSQLQTPYAQQMPQSNIQQQIHDSGFRDYCSQLIDRQLDELCVQLLITLKRFQDRKKQQFQSNPDRARRKRRFVHGIREVTKHLRLQRLKCVLIAPDCQSIQSQGGLNDVLEQIINLCKEQDIPYIFTLNRQKLGRCLNKISRISTIGIFDYSGADQIYKQIVEIANENQRAYKQILDNIPNHDEPITTPSHGLNSKEFYKILHRTFQQQQQQPQQRPHIINTIPNESLSKVLPKVPAHYAHSRQTSDTSMIYIDPQLINSIKKQHTRASSGTFEMGSKGPTKKHHQRTLSDGATAIDDTSIQIKHHVKTHSRTPSGCSAISQIEQQEYFEQSKNILLMNNNNNNPNDELDSDENRLKSINEDTEENYANIKRKNVEKWINDN